jgi:hypothetical protein
MFTYLIPLVWENVSTEAKEAGEHQTYKATYHSQREASAL